MAVEVGELRREEHLSPLADPRSSALRPLAERVIDFLCPGAGASRALQSVKSNNCRSICRFRNSMPSSHNFSYSRSPCSPCNCFYVLNALPEDESFTSDQTLENILDEVLAQGHESYRQASDLAQQLACPDRASFDASIQRISIDVRDGGMPMVFIHGHVNKTDGLRLASGTYVPWSAYLDSLMCITTATGGELTVIAAFCHSMEIVPLLPNTGRLPFSFYYGYDGTITAGEVHDETAMLYRGFFRDGGRAGTDPTARLKHYSEFDHVEEVLRQFLALYGAHDEKRIAYPMLSKRKILKSTEQQFLAQGEPLGGVRNNVIDAIGGAELVNEVLGKFMYETDRRSRLIREVIQWHGQIKDALNKPPSGAGR